MVFKKISALSTALLLALASLFTFAFVDHVQALGTTRYWCDFSTDGNWNNGSYWNTNSDCSSGISGAPQPGDSVVFDNSHLSSTIQATNNIAGLDINSITFQGNGIAGYILAESPGNDISLDSGIVDSGTNSVTNNVDINMTLTANQAISSGPGNDALDITGSIHTQTFSLSLTPNATHNISLADFDGSGGLTFNGPSSGSGVATYALADPESGYSGPTTINSNAAVQDQSGNLTGLGSGTITVNSGGSLYLSDASSSGTLGNNLVLNGNGDGVDNFGSLISCLGPSSCTSANSILTLSGKVTLNGNSEVINGAFVSGEISPPSSSATFDFTGNITYNGHTLKAYPSSNTIVNLPAAASSAKSNVGAPNTGVGLVTNHSYLAFIGGLLLATAAISTSLALSRRQNKRNSTRK